MNLTQVRNDIDRIRKMNGSKKTIRTASQENMNALTFAESVEELCDYCEYLEKRVDRLEKLHYQKGERI